MKRCDKRAQMKLSFGMMFSVILIIIFLAFTFYAIKTLLGMNDAVTVGKFYDSLQDDVDRMWGASQGSQEETYRLPRKVEMICFASFGPGEIGTGINAGIYDELIYGYHRDENLIFFPLDSGGGLSSGTIKHIDIDRMTSENNPLCFENVKGKITINIEKIYGEQLSTIN